jgi:hypothetical protein
MKKQQAEARILAIATEIAALEAERAECQNVIFADTSLYKVGQIVEEVDNPEYRYQVSGFIENGVTGLYVRKNLTLSERTYNLPNEKITGSSFDLKAAQVELEEEKAEAARIKAENRAKKKAEKAVKEPEAVIEKRRPATDEEKATLPKLPKGKAKAAAAKK